MDAERIFVGRKAELEQFKEVLEDPQGQAVLVVGQSGMGKTWLVNKMAELAENHPKLKFGWVRYEVTPTDSVDSTMALMMDNAFETAQIKEGSFSGTTQRLEQWKSLLNVINIGDLVMSLKRNPEKNTRDQFLERLRLISKRMSKNGRAIFVIDPEKYMQKESDQSWAIVIKELPEKIKFVFAQRPEDVLVESEAFSNLDNVSRIPETRLDILDEDSVDELLNQRVTGLKYSVTEVRKVLSQYKGHPYALQGSLDLLKAETKLEELPGDPTGIAAAQWKELSKRGKEAIRLFKAYAILEVEVPNEVVEAVSKLDEDAIQSLLADNYLGGLLREEGEGKRIYHAILADFILEQIVKAERMEYHLRAVGVYRGKLAKAEKEQIQPDTLAAMRLTEHVLATEGKEAFVDVFINECGKALMNIGLLDNFIRLTERALVSVEKNSKEEAMVTGNLGSVYYTRGEFDKAEEMYEKSLKIAEKLGLQEILANVYCCLGIVYRTRGNVDKAEEMHLKSLEIDEKLGRLEGIAGSYGNLGSVYYTQGDLDKAEDMYQKSMEIYKKLGRIEGMASDYGNLGNVYQTRGDLDKAEKMHLKSLDIDRKLGRLEGMADDYGNLGLLYQTRGELDKAEEMHLKSLEIEKKLGRLQGMAYDYGNLGNVYKARGELDKAEEMFKKIMKIHEDLGHQGGLANDYSNLGSVYKQRGDVGKAKECWEKAVGLYKKIGMPHMEEKVEGFIRGIDK